MIVRGTKIGDVIRIVDVTGKVILSQDASIANTINTSKLATGNYVLQVISGNKIENIKLVKE